MKTVILSLCQILCSVSIYGLPPSGQRHSDYQPKTEIIRTEKNARLAKATEKGNLYVTAGIPLFTQMKSVYSKSDSYNSVGFLGGELGLRWNYTDKRSLRVFAGMNAAYNRFSFITYDCGPDLDPSDPQYDPFTASCASIYDRRIYLGATHGHEYRYGSIGYGVSLTRNTAQNSLGVHFNQWTTGLIFSFGLRAAPVLVISLDYNPTFFRFREGDSKMAYQHYVSMNFRFDIKVKKL